MQQHDSLFAAEELFLQFPLMTEKQFTEVLSLK
jgi:hypothetical protein